MKFVPNIASAIALSIAAHSAVAHERGDHTNKPGAQGGGHASMLGKAGNPKDVTRTIEVAMSDTMRFSPSDIAVKRGETIRFVLRNDGKIKHEMVLGTVKELKEHAALMRKFPEMEHADPNQVSVEPGKTGDMIWQFNRAGKVDFACLQPGHFEAGMVGKVTVSNLTAEKKAAAIN